MKNWKQKLKSIIIIAVLFSSSITPVLDFLDKNYVEMDKVNSGDNNSVRNVRDELNGSPETMDDQELFPNLWEILFNLDADDWGYKEWKKYVIVDFCNLTQKDFYQHTKNDPKANLILNKLIKLLWGTYNGSLSEEDSRDLKSQLYSQTTNIYAADIIQKDEFYVVIDVSYRVHSVWWWHDRALTLEIRFRTLYDSTFYTTGGWLNHKYHDNIPDPNKVPIFEDGYSIYVYPDIKFYPMDSGKRVFYKILHTVDTNVWDDKYTWYYEHIEIPTGYVLKDVYVHAILTYDNPPFSAAYASSVAHKVNIDDDDDDPPEFLDFQACFENDTLGDKDLGKTLYIFTDSNGNPLSEMDKSIYVRVNYNDASGIYWKYLAYRFKAIDGSVYYPSNNRPDFDKSKDRFIIPHLDWRNALGFLETIQISSRATDNDFDRANDYLVSNWTHLIYDQWITVAKVVRQELDLERLNIKFEFSNDILKPYVIYNPYVGESVSFSLKLVNGFNHSIQINEINYAVVPTDLSIIPIFITQRLTSFEIKKLTGKSSPFFNSPELLEQFDELGTYTLQIIINYTLLSQVFLAYFEDSFEVIAPECPKVNFYLEDDKLEVRAFTLANFIIMEYKDIILSSAKMYEWQIKVENPSRLSLQLNDTLRFQLQFLEGKSNNKLVIKEGAIIDIAVKPLFIETYPFILEITDPSVFPKELISDILDDTIIDMINDWMGTGSNVYEIIQNLMFILKGIELSDIPGLEYIGLAFDIKHIIHDIWGGIETATNLDLHNSFFIQCLTGHTSWNYVSEGIEIFSDLNKDYLNSSDLSFEVLTLPSAKQFAYIDYYFILQWDILGLDIASAAADLAMLLGNNPYVAIGCALIDIYLFIRKEVEKAEQDEVKKRCDDPEPPSGDYTKLVPINYTKVTIPHKFENNLRYSSCLYNLLQAHEDIKAEREAQQEIVNRMNLAIEKNESGWAIFQLNELKESINREQLFSENLTKGLKKFNTLYFEDLVNINIKNQDFIIAENYVEEYGLPLELRQLFNFTEEQEEELIQYVSHISEYPFLDVTNPDNDYTYAEFPKILNMKLEEKSEFITKVNDETNNKIVDFYVDLSLKSGISSYKLNETDILLLESLNQSIKEKILLKEWINVINLCDEVIELTNDLSSKIFNSSHPILLAYNIYAQALKRETLEHNRRHLFILSTSFDECQTLESEKIGSAKIDVKLVNASSPDTVELTVQNLAGTFRFLNEDGVEINQIMLIPNVFSTIYLEYSFNENVDYGTHTIDLMFKELNYDTYYHKKIIINLVEDGDTTPPVITIDYLKGDGTDGNPGVWEVFAYDRESVVNDEMIKIYIDDLLIGDSFGDYEVPTILGNHTVRVEVWNNDSTDPEFAVKTTTITIVDDDTKPPVIKLEYMGDGLDSTPGYFTWQTLDSDDNIGGDKDIGFADISIMINYTSSEGLPDEQFALTPNESGIWYLPSNLGTYKISVFAQDNDDDRFLYLDSLTTQAILIQQINDDDSDPPLLSNLEIVAGTFEINISFDALDTYSGIGDIIIYVNGEAVNHFFHFQSGSTFFFLIPNEWLFEKGDSEIMVVVFDADNDRPNDSLSSIISGTFQNVLYQMYNYVDWQLEQLISYITDNIDCCKARGLIWKLTRAREYLSEAFDLMEQGDIICGLYHDKMAKLMVYLTEIKLEYRYHHNHHYRCCQITSEESKFIVASLHEIRNNIVILMGASTGNEQAYEIAYLEVELFNLHNYIEGEMSRCSSKCLSMKIWCASHCLEIAILKISKGEDVDYLLKCVKWKLEHLNCKIDQMVKKGGISEESAQYLKSEINHIIESIDLLRNI